MPLNSKQALKLYIVLSRAYNTVAEADKKEIRKYGISPSEFATLELLYHKGPQPVQQIAAKVLLTSGSMTYVVTQLQKKGLIERTVCEDDRRIFYVTLTDAGNTLISDIFPSHEAAIAQMFHALTDEDAQALITHLKRLGKSIDKEETT